MTTYSHRYHAGNHADVLKHVALLTLVKDVTARAGGAVTFVETHAGEGRYTLGPTGEWTEGIGRLDSAGSATRAALSDYFDHLQRLDAAHRTPNRGGPYPGSPLMALSALRANDRVVLVEKQADAVDALRRAVAQDKRAQVIHGDGWATLRETLAGLSDGEAARTVVHIDPAFNDPDEWRVAGEALIACKQAGVRAALWYPIKSLTRPNTLLARLSAARAGATTVEAHVTPLDMKRNALNGSGVALVGVDAEVVFTLAARSAALSEALATHEGRYTVRVQRTA